LDSSTPSFIILQEAVLLWKGGNGGVNCWIAVHPALLYYRRLYCCDREVLVVLIVG